MVKYYTLSKLLQLIKAYNSDHFGGHFRNVIEILHRLVLTSIPCEHHCGSYGGLKICKIEIIIQ